MPQDIALVEELTIKETIFYFGRIYGMNDDKIQERLTILQGLLELPPKGEYIHTPFFILFKSTPNLLCVLSCRENGWQAEWRSETKSLIRLRISTRTGISYFR